MASAGIYSQEIDQSLYASNESDNYFGVVGHFSKGPLNELTLITSYTELLATFGKPRSDGTSYAWYASREYLRRGNKLEVVRVESAATPAVAAKSSIRGFGTAVVAAGSVNGTSVAGAGIWDDAGADFVTAKVQPGDILHVSAGADAGYYEIDTVPILTRVTVKNVAAWPSGGAAGQTYAIITGRRQLRADGATSTPALRTFTSATGKFMGGTANCNAQVGDILRILDVGTPGDNGLYVVSQVTGATTLVVNRDWSVGSLAALDYELYSYIAGQETGATSVPATREFTCATHNFLFHDVRAGDILVIDDTTHPADDGRYIIVSLTPTVLTVNRNWPVGSLANLTFRVYPAAIRLEAKTKGIWGDELEHFVTPYVGDEANKFNIEFRESGVPVEKWFGVGYSTIVADLAASVIVTPTVLTGRGGVPASHDEDFDDGADGNSGMVDGDFIGAAGSALQLFASAESVRVDELAVPGVHSQAVGDALVALGESRKNTLVLLDPPPWATVDHPTEVVQWHNGLGAYGRVTPVASSYAAVCWPWVEVYDEYNDAYVATPPSGHHAAALAYTDKASFPWYAPAGGSRGKLLGASGLPMTPDQGQRDYMQTGTNCVNPIVVFAAEGTMIYGQKTCYRYNTALNRINVRRMVMWLTSRAAAALRLVVFDPNDESTWKRVYDTINPLCRYVKRNRGLSDFLVVCDSTNNTALTRANYQLIADIYLKPTPTAEEIILRFTLTSQDANFEELMGA